MMHIVSQSAPLSSSHSVVSTLRYYSLSGFRHANITLTLESHLLPRHGSRDMDLYIQHVTWRFSRPSWTSVSMLAPELNSSLWFQLIPLMSWFLLAFYAYYSHWAELRYDVGDCFWITGLIIWIFIVNQESQVSIHRNCMRLSFSINFTNSDPISPLASCW